MLSQLSKTIKMALKSTEEERAILRARSAVQRFPVVEWRQRTEDFHKRSIYQSRTIAGHDAWRPSDGGMVATSAIEDTDDWDPAHETHPSQPDWDSRSISNSPHVNTPGGQWSQESLTPGGDPFLTAPPRLLPDNRRGSFSTDISDVEGDYRNSIDTRPEGQQEFGNFLDRANRTIAKDQRNAPDPFLEAPTRPFGAHNRISSVESIASIVDEKSNSPLNKAIASVWLSLSSLPLKADIFYSSLIPMVVSLKNLCRSCRTCHQRTLRVNCRSSATFKRAKKLSSTRFGKISFPALQVSDLRKETQFGEPLHHPCMTTPAHHVRVFTILFLSHLTFFSAPNAPPSSAGGYGDYDGPLPHDNGEVVIMTGLQIAMAREIGGWPLYTIVIALGQVRPNVFSLAFLF